RRPGAARGAGAPPPPREPGAEPDGSSPPPRSRDGGPGAILPFSLRPATIVGWSTVALLAVVAAGLSSGAALWVFAAVAAGLLAALPVVLSIVGERRHRRYGNTPTVAQIGSAIAEALHALDLSTAGADAVRMRIDARGDLRCHLDADPASAEVFAHAFDEAVS